MRLAMVAPTGDGVALQGRLGADVLLEGIEAVQGVAGAELMQHVAGVLVDLNRARGEADQIVSTIGERDERGQRNGCGVAGSSDCRPLVWRVNGCA